ncbi:26S proteasome regulatory subunit 8-like A, partial [Cucurbita argyrosperma subsp. sororia]
MATMELDTTLPEATLEETCSAKLATKQGEGLRHYYLQHIQDLQLQLRLKTHNLNRLEAQRNELNSRVRLLREELQLLQEPGSYVGEVVKVMGKNKVLVKVHPEGKYVVDIDKSIDITKITPSTRVALRNDSYVLHLVLPSKVDPLVNLMKVEKVPDSTYDMIGGLDQQIKEIKEVIELPIKHPELFESLGIAQPKKYIGEGSRMVRELFVMAREHAPSIIFMDEIDSIGSARMESGSGNSDSEVQRTMLELLNQLDGFEASNKIKVLMATNRIDILDQALLRPGRIDRKIEFPNPNEESRFDILKIHSRKMNLMRGIDLKKIAEKMNGASGAELKAVCTEAGMFALRERRVHVTQEDFEMAVAKPCLGIKGRAVGCDSNSKESSPPSTKCFGGDLTQFPTSNLFAAAGDGVWENGAACGRQYFVRCFSASDPEACVPDQTIQITIVDYAPSIVSVPTATGTTMILSTTAYNSIVNTSATVNFVTVEFLQV